MRPQPLLDVGALEQAGNALMVKRGARGHQGRVCREWQGEGDDEQAGQQTAELGDHAFLLFLFMKILAPEVLAFWFGADAEYGVAQKRWFQKDPAFDAEVRRRFLSLHAELAGNDEWLDAPRECLARIIVL